MKLLKLLAKAAKVAVKVAPVVVAALKKPK